MTLELLVVAMVVGVAGVAAAWMVYRSLTRPAASCHTQCGCEQAQACQPPSHGAHPCEGADPGAGGSHDA